MEQFHEKSTKKFIITLSTIKTEFVACFEVTTQTLWLQSFISGLKVVDTITKPLKIFCDNFVAVFFIRTKNILKMLSI